MTMRAKPLLTVALLLGTASCTMVTTATPPERDADVRMDLGLAALENQQFRAAFDELSWVYTQCAGYERGVQALVGLAALELDARNEAGRPGTGAELLARLITEPGQPDWLRPLTESSYLMALALGAPAVGQAGAAPDTGAAVTPDTLPGDTAPATSGEPLAEAAPDDRRRLPPPGQRERLRTNRDEPVYNCGAPVPTDEATRSLPTLPGPSLVALLAEAEAARDASTSRTEALNAELQALRQRLQETEQELERIRRTLRP